MEDNHMRVDMMMDLDLNQEPLDPPSNSVLELGSSLNDETTRSGIEHRLRQLEAVTARARLRQRWRQAQNPPETTNFPTQQIINAVNESEGHNGEVSMSKSCKRNSTHLIAKALEMDMEVKKVKIEGGSFFDCNICLKMARDPILTCCGHLFCWACFYELPYGPYPYVYSTAKECPACKGEVIETAITPVYTNGNKTHVSESESGSKVPPRPQAHRVESVRQQRVNRGVSLITVAEELRRIRTGFGANRQELERISGSSERANLPVSQISPSNLLPNTEAGASRRPRTRQFSRVLSESAASLSSISPALNDAEISVDNLDSYMHEGPSNGTIMLSEHQSVDPTAEINSTPTEGNLNVPRPSSSRRRRGASRVSDVQSAVLREHRRRRRLR